MAFTKSLVNTDSHAGPGIWPFSGINATCHFALGKIAKASPLPTAFRGEEVSNRPKFLRLDSTGERKNEMDFNEASCGSYKAPAKDHSMASHANAGDTLRSIDQQLFSGFRLRYQPYSKDQSRRASREKNRISLTELCEDFFTKVNLNGTSCYTKTTKSRSIKICVNGFLAKQVYSACSSNCEAVPKSTASADVMPAQVYVDPETPSQDVQDNPVSQPLHYASNKPTHAVYQEISVDRNVDTESKADTDVKIPEIVKDTEFSNYNHISCENSDPSTGEGVCDSNHGDDKVSDPVTDSNPQVRDNQIGNSVGEIKCVLPNQDISADARDSNNGQIERLVGVVCDSSVYFSCQNEGSSAPGCLQSNSLPSVESTDTSLDVTCCLSFESSTGDSTDYVNASEHVAQSSSDQSSISRPAECDTTESLLSEVANRLSATSLSSIGSFSGYHDSSCDGDDEEYQSGPVQFRLGSEDDDSDSDWSHDSDFDELDGEAAQENDKLWKLFEKKNPFCEIPVCNSSPKTPKLLKVSSSPDILSGTTSPHYSTPISTSPPLECSYSPSQTSRRTDKQNYQRDYCKPEPTNPRKLGRSTSNNYSAPNLNTVEECEESSQSSTPKKKVRFADEESLVVVHTMVTWKYAYKACRKGPWEQYALDRCRFSRKIDEVGSIISPCLTPEHRRHVYQNLNSTF
ncbi:uncharacterized protein [Ptychodera flava]|uniref:uncharacterized protein n=1 Tax=Ptychodera flava TaxID=63121 RepID=UPI003969C34F